jgi:hypothetical protein
MGDFAHNLLLLAKVDQQHSISPLADEKVHKLISSVVEEFSLASSEKQSQLYRQICSQCRCLQTQTRCKRSFQICKKNSINYTDSVGTVTVS